LPISGPSINSGAVGTSTAKSSTPRQRLTEDERRRQIMTAAVHELADRGYDGVSLTRIAEQAGVSKGLVWHYFAGGKDDLMEATLKATIALIGDRITGMLDLTRPVPDIIRAALRQAAALSVTHQAELRALNHIVHNLRRPDGTPRLTLDVYRETYEMQEKLFRRGQAEGTLRDFDTRVMAVTYQGAIAMMLRYLETNADVNPERYAAELAEILLVGIRRA
jgi:AcrR family transcriptional regulator